MFPRTSTTREITVSPFRLAKQAGAQHARPQILFKGLKCNLWPKKTLGQAVWPSTVKQRDGGHGTTTERTSPETTLTTPQNLLRTKLKHSKFQYHMIDPKNANEEVKLLPNLPMSKHPSNLGLAPVGEALPQSHNLGKWWIERALSSLMCFQHQSIPGHWWHCFDPYPFIKHLKKFWVKSHQF